MADGPIQATIRAVAEAIDRAADRFEPSVRVLELGHVVAIQDDVLRIRGLREAAVDEIVEVGSKRALVLSLDRREVRAILLDEPGGIGEGSTVRSRGAVASIRVGEGLFGRVVDPLGRALDGAPLAGSLSEVPLQRPAPGIHERGPVHSPLATGVLAVDALFPIGRGQRELIIGDVGTGKTSFVLDVMLRQRDTDVVCVYVAIGRRRGETVAVVEELRRGGGRYVVVSAPEDIGPGLRYLAPYSGVAVAEHFALRGEHALVVFNDLSAHAVAWRELALLLRRPPGREAYPGDVFYLHARLLERAAQLAPELGGGSVTALPVAVLDGGRLTAYIPTNLISITDGQLVFSDTLFTAGQKPAIDGTLSVSRVGARAQPQAIRALGAKLKLDYASFLELEAFSRLGTRLDASTERTIERGRRIRRLLRAQRGQSLDLVGEVVRLLLAASDALLRVPEDEVGAAAQACDEAARVQHGALCDQIRRDGVIHQTAREALEQTLERVVSASWAA
ncbi:MAG: F0F1 ATP synthase subunit alpha [Polyangiaceae bacterium]|nr:F0F1 ATP synthase subunit alpha [Polyangiaceae bacterium]